MTLAELEEAKKTLRKTLESQKSAISISKEVGANRSRQAGTGRILRELYIRPTRS